jgi:hypothetical protein
MCPPSLLRIKDDEHLIREQKSLVDKGFRNTDFARVEESLVLGFSLSNAQML